MPDVNRMLVWKKPVHVALVVMYGQYKAFVLLVQEPCTDATKPLY